MSTLSTGSSKPSIRGRQAALKRAAEHSVFGLVPIAATLALIAVQFHLNAVALDFHVAYWPAVHRLLHGLSPYAVTHRQVLGGAAFVYPALAAVLLAPFGLISNGVAQVLFMMLCLACVPAVLYMLGVRDWRLYGLALLWFPVFDGWQSGNLTLPLALLVALVWRHRERPLVAGLLTAVAISLKTFVWPLGLWLLATRRWKAAAWALVAGIVVNLLAWAIVGYDEISVFLHLSAQDTNALWRQGYSMLAVAHHLGLGRSAGDALLLAASVAAAVVLFYSGLMKRDERQALLWATLVMLCATPLLWAHYFSLLLIPLALYHTRLRFAWALPLLTWPIPPRQPVYGWEEILAWGVAASCFYAALRTGRPRELGSPDRRFKRLSASPP